MSDNFLPEYRPSITRIGKKSMNCLDRGTQVIALILATELVYIIAIYELMYFQMTCKKVDQESEFFLI